MIKLKNILNEIFEETRQSEMVGGTLDHCFKTDGENILAICTETDELEICLAIEYSGHILQAEIEGYQITNILVNNDRQYDFNFLHPIQKKRISDLADEYVHNNEEEIQRLITNQES